MNVHIVNTSHSSAEFASQILGALKISYKQNCEMLCCRHFH